MTTTTNDEYSRTSNCEQCGTPTSFERTDPKTQPHEGEVCERCGMWVCVDCAHETGKPCPPYQQPTQPAPDDDLCKWVDADNVVQSGPHQFENGRCSTCGTIAPDGEEWRVLDEGSRSKVVNDSGRTVAMGCGGNTQQRRRHAAQIVAEHNAVRILRAALEDLIHQLPSDERLADFNLDLAERALATTTQPDAGEGRDD